MNRRNQLIVSLFVGLAWTTACEKNNQETEYPEDQMGQTQPTSMPTETTPPAEPTTEEPAPVPEQPKPLAEGDKKFVETAAKDGKAEVDLGQLALTKAKKQTVKDFAQLMVDDHGKANEELMALASTKGLDLAAPANAGATDPAADPAMADKRAALDKLTGSKFEKQYVATMVEAHEKAVALFREQSTSGMDPELKDWAAKTLPKLEEHLAHAKALKAGKPYKPANNAAQASAGDPAGKAEAGTAPAATK
jgi:putative membrane protein